MTSTPRKILCAYATRQIDSNLFMASTVFAGLHKACLTVDMVFCGNERSCAVFEEKYAKYFRKVFYIESRDTVVEKYCRNCPRLNLLYNFIREFFLCIFVSRYSLKKLSNLQLKEYDCVLSFIPTFESGKMGHDIAKKILNDVRLVQYWSDPLSLGRLNNIDEIPWYRALHVYDERKLLKHADKVVFCYPLLRDMEAKLHPEYEHKMTWSDVGYVEHELDGYVPCNQRLRIGLFGSYHERVRNIFPLLKAIRKFPNVQFVIRGDSDVDVSEYVGENLDIEPGRIPVEQVEKLEAGCDALLCLGGRSGITHPAGKVFYYASYRKPILYIGDGLHNEYFKKYLQDFGRYLICDNTETSIKTGIQLLIDAIPYKGSIPERMKLDVIANKIVS